MGCARLLLLPPPCEELLRDVVRLWLLDAVRVREMPVRELFVLGAGRHSACASWFSYMGAGAFPLDTVCFSFFSTSFCWIFRLRAPRADMTWR